MAIDRTVSFKKVDLLTLEQVLVMIERYRREPKTEYLIEIGSRLHEISWNEDDGGCIRNKHGYRNRAKNGSNKINTTGASIDFETLGHLRRLAADPNSAPMLQTHTAAIQGSLDQLERKIWHIVRDETQFIDQHDRTLFPKRNDAVLLSQNYDVNCSLLWYYCAYYHDTYCINKIIEYLEVFSRLQHADLSSINNRYHLAYIFCQMGELAKEVSDFIKVEHTPTVAEQNVVRFLFTKLGHYRQRIKNQPYIVHNSSAFYLVQMRTALSTILPDLMAVLLDLRGRLSRFDLNNLQNYCSILDFQDHVNPRSFENTYSRLLRQLSGVLRLGTKKKLRNIPQKIHENIVRLTVEIRSIDEEIEKSRQPVVIVSAEAIPAEHRELQHTKNTQQLLGVLSLDICKPYFNRTFSEVKVLCDYPSKTFDKSLSDEQKVIVKKLRSLCLLYSNSQRLISSLNLKVKNLDDLTLAEVHDLLEPATEAQKIGNLTASLEHKLSVRQKMLNEEKALHNQATNFLSAVESNCKNEHREFNRDASDIESAIANLVDVLSYLSSASEKLSGPQDISHDILMAIGLIGQYSRTLFELTKNSLIRKHINALLEECMKRADHLRSKMIFHDSTNQDPRAIFESLDELILPIRRDFEALKIVVSPQAIGIIELVKAFMRLGLQTEALRLLYEHLEKVEMESRAGAENFEAQADALDRDGVFPGHASYLRFLRHFLPEEAQRTLASESAYLIDKINILLLMLDCYLHQQNFLSALEINEQLITLLSNILKKLRASRMIVQTDLTLPVLHEIEDIYLYTLAQKSYLYLNLGDHSASKATMDTIAGIFDRDPASARRHGSMLARFYTDLCYENSNDPVLAERYIAFVEGILIYCPDRLIVEYNIHFRRYELALRDIQSIHSAVMRFSKYFYSHERQFKNAYGIHYYFYKMEVLLAEYNMYAIRNDRGNVQRVMDELDSIQVHVSDLVLKNKYFTSKLCELSASQNTLEFTQIFNQFCIMNRDANNHRKLISLTIKLIRNIKAHDKKSAQLCVTFLLNQCSEHLKEDEMAFLNAVNKIYSTSQPRFVGNPVKRNDPCHCGSGKKFKKCHLGQPK